MATSDPPSPLPLHGNEERNPLYLYRGQQAVWGLVGGRGVQFWFNCTGRREVGLLLVQKHRGAGEPGHGTETKMTLSCVGVLGTPEAAILHNFAASASKLQKSEPEDRSEKAPALVARLSPSWVAKEEQWGGLHGRASS